MGGYLTVSSKEHCGSTFSFVLPYRVSPISDDHSNDADELPYRSDHDYTPDIATSYFQFQPRTLGSLLSSAVSSEKQNLLPINFQHTMLLGVNGLQGGAYTFPSGTTTSKEMASLGSACDEADAR
ncbi:hypothetical protein Ancab_019979 [Ancistrocladus abbreviatus]